MTTPDMHGPLRVETVDGHPWVLGEGIACACGDMAEAEALLADMQRRMSESLRRAISRAFEVLAADGWITTIEVDRTGAVCRGFDRNPSAPGFAAVVQPVVGDSAVIEVGEGLGDEDADLDAAKVVAAALLAAGLDSTTELREGAVFVAVRRPGTDPNEALAKRVAASIREQHGLKPTEFVRVSIHGEDGSVVWQGEVK